jgi:hypothetical protein
LNPLSCLQTTISVEFNTVTSISDYELQWKAIEQNWADASSSAVLSSGKKGTAEADDLTPGTTYCIRLACTSGGATGEPGPELIIDTEQVGCTPKKSGGCGCVIQ